MNPLMLILIGLTALMLILMVCQLARRRRAKRRGLWP